MRIYSVKQSTNFEAQTNIWAKQREANLAGILKRSRPSRPGLVSKIIRLGSGVVNSITGMRIGS